jgi:kinesin family protein 2/24
VQDLFRLSANKGAVAFSMSFYEIYGGKIIDLLNNKKKLQVMEDANNRIQIQGLEEKEAASMEEMMEIINYGHSVRTTHCTAANDTSSRSHAVCQIFVREGQRSLGKLLLVDLAGSERAQDTQSNNR